MKIAFFVHGYLPWDVYGVPRYIERLSNFLVNNGHEVIIIVAGRPMLPKIEKTGNLTIYRLRYFELGSESLRPLWSLFLYTMGCCSEGLKFVKEQKIDILHGHTIQYGGFQAALASILTGRECIITIHGIGLEKYDSKKMPLKLRFLKNISALVVQKSSAYNKLLRWGYRNKVVLAGGCVDVNKFKPLSAKSLQQKQVITFIGRLTNFKGPQLLIQAAPYILAKNSNVTFQIVGEGELKVELMKQIKLNGLEKHVFLLGFRENVDELLRNSAVSVHLSPYENFSDLALLEAMSSGVPVVATRVGETAGIVEDGKTGLLTQPNPKDIAEKIVSILDNPLLAESLSRNERALVVNNFSIDVLGRRHEKLYYEAIMRKAENKGM